MAPPLYNQASVCVGERAAHPVPDCPHLRRSQLAPAQLARLSHHLGGTQVCEDAKYLLYFYVIILRETFYCESILWILMVYHLSYLLSQAPDRNPKTRPSKK
jgi:hypothetical protein